MKKEPSEAQLAARAKFAAAAKARAEAKRAEKSLEMQTAQPTVAPNTAVPIRGVATVSDEEPTTPVPAPTPSQPDQNDMQLLLARIKELEDKQFFPAPQLQNQNPLVRSVTKFSVVAADYPDPRDKLFEEPKLQLQGFNKNWWALEWSVARTQYDKDGVHYSEPKFTLELWKIIEDEEGLPSNKRFRVCTGIFFEDPDSYVTIANEKGLDVPEDIQKPFLDEMRYMGLRDWLLESFYPPKPSANTTKVETVIGNVLVEVIEVNSVDAQNVGAQLAK